MHGTPEEKILLQTIQNLHQKERKAETKTIQNELERTTQTSWELQKLLPALNRLEEYGFIKKDIKNTNNEPRLVWKIYIPTT